MDGLAGVRAALRDLLPPEAVEAAVLAYEREGLRLQQVERAVDADRTGPAGTAGTSPGCEAGRTGRG